MEHPLSAITQELFYSISVKLIQIVVTLEIFNLEILSLESIKLEVSYKDEC